MSIIKAENLTKSYGDNQNNLTRAVDDISLHIEKGEFTAIMGPSGSGKSTLLGCLSGMVKPNGGGVVIDNQNIMNYDKAEMAEFRRKKLGFVFQDFNLMDNLSVRENIILPMVFDNGDKDTMDSMADTYMKKFGIYECRDKYPSEISGGQMQRTAVARALINNPLIIYADEPTGNLDSKSSGRIMNCFEEINQEFKTTILMVTHDVFAASFCGRVIFIKDGKVNMEIVRKGSRQEFFEKILECQAVVGGDFSDI